jgi:hypothetical protein
MNIRHHTQNFMGWTVKLPKSTESSSTGGVTNDGHGVMVPVAPRISFVESPPPQSLSAFSSGSSRSESKSPVGIPRHHKTGSFHYNNQDRLVLVPDALVVPNNAHSRSNSSSMRSFDDHDNNANVFIARRDRSDSKGAVDDGRRLAKKRSARMDASARQSLAPQRKTFRKFPVDEPSFHDSQVDDSTGSGAISLRSRSASRNRDETKHAAKRDMFKTLRVKRRSSNYSYGSIRHNTLPPSSVTPLLNGVDEDPEIANEEATALLPSPSHSGPSPSLSTVFRGCVAYGRDSSSFVRHYYDDDTVFEKWNDKQWLITFFVHIVCLLGLSVYILNPNHIPVATDLMTHWILGSTDSDLSILFLSICCNFLFSCIILISQLYISLVIERVSRVRLIFTLNTFCFVCGIFSLVMLPNKGPTLDGVIVWTIATLLSSLATYMIFGIPSVKSKFILTEALLSIACKAITSSLPLVLVMISFCVLQLAIALFYILIMVTCTKTVSLWITLCLLLPSYIWTSAVLEEIVQTTIAGMTSMWYLQLFDSGASVTKALRRAISISFGSICVRPFAIAVYRMVKAVKFLTCKRKSMDITEDSEVIFDRYVLIQFAMYGKDFRTAATHVKRLLQIKGFGVVLREEHSNAVFMLTYLICGAAVTVIGTTILYIGHGHHWTVVQIVQSVLLSLLMGYRISSCVLEIFISSLNSLIVLWAEDGSSLTAKQECFHRIAAAVWQQIPSFGYYVS